MFLVSGLKLFHSTAPKYPILLVGLTSQNANIKEGGIMCPSSDFRCIQKMLLRGLPLITYAPRGVGGVKPPIHFHCVFTCKKGVGGFR